MAIVFPVATEMSIVGPSAFPGVITKGSGVQTIFVGAMKQPIATSGCLVSPHGETPPHPSFTGLGNPAVMANFKPVVYQTDPTSCGHPIIFGNLEMVFVNAV